MGKEFKYYQGTEFKEEKLDLLLMTHEDLSIICRVDLNLLECRLIDIPEGGIPQHFIEITEVKFTELVNKYFIENDNI